MKYATALLVMAMPVNAQIMRQNGPASGTGVSIVYGTATITNLCVDNGATSCGTIKAGDSTGGNVGVGTASPGTKLHMSSGTLTVDGTGAAVNIAGSTFTVANSGIISAPSQPGIALALTNNEAVLSGAFRTIPWGKQQYKRNIAHPGFDAAASSGTVTIPTGGAGIYFLSCSLQWAANATGARIARILINGSSIADSLLPGNGSVEVITTAVRMVSLAAGDAVTCSGFQDSGGNLNVVVNAAEGSTFTVQRVW